ncbi:MAG TPA: AraC family transcriptional regulator [Bryobacteraceae bacterium]|nr:AraC family transcriptional regulator [Bryobacteraceae bacterium]
MNTVSAALGKENAVLRGRARGHCVREFPGPLSIKAVLEGSIAWKIGRRELPVDRDSFLVVSRDEPYSMEFESRTPVSTFCVFFQDGFVESVCGSVAQEVLEPDSRSVDFARGLHLADSGILPRMRALAEAPPRPRLWVDEQFLELARDLALLDAHVAARVRRMPARRTATRDELFRRVRRGQEVLHARACEDLGLAEIARESALSAFHFHRAFTSAFGRTPNQYRNELRMARARRLIESTAMTITEVCGAVGLESLPSFSASFRKAHGAPPSAFRQGK